MSLEVLKKLAEESSNDEFLSAVKGVESTYNANVERLGSLEKDLTKAIQKRDGVKQIVKTKLGIDDISEEALDSFLKTLKENADGTVIAENQKLSEIVNSLKSEKDSVEGKYKQELNSYKLERALSDIGGREDSNGTQAYSILLGEVSNGASFDENGNIIFRANDGTTLRNSDGTPMGLKDRYNVIRESDEFSFLFKSKKSKSGSGKEPNGQRGDSNMNLKRSTMSHAEKGKYIQEHGQDSYLKLPN